MVRFTLVKEVEHFFFTVFINVIDFHRSYLPRSCAFKMYKEKGFRTFNNTRKLTI